MYNTTLGTSKGLHLFNEKAIYKWDLENYQPVSNGKVSGMGWLLNHQSNVPLNKTRQQKLQEEHRASTAIMYSASHKLNLALKPGEVIGYKLNPITLKR